MVSRLQILVVAGAGLALLSFGIGFAQHQHSDGTSGQSKDMMPGTYTAKVKAIVCGMYGPLIQKTLQNFKELDAVTRAAMIQIQGRARGEILYRHRGRILRIGSMAVG